MNLINRQFRYDINRRCRPGIVLMMTVVLLVILSILGYTLVSRMAAQRHRDQYLIDYQTARYACDSGVKYALVTLTDINTANLVSRPNEPDFSDLFSLNQEQYDRMLADWARQNPPAKNQGPNDANITNVANNTNVTADSSVAAALNALRNLDGLGDNNGLNKFKGLGDLNSLFAKRGLSEPNVISSEANAITIRGPYGPAWPYVMAPVEFQIGSTTVKIAIEDENAKYPLGWALLGDKDSQRDAKASLGTFCEWMGMGRTELDDLESQLEKIAAIKTFKLDFQPTQMAPEEQQPQQRRVRGRRRATAGNPSVIPPIVHIADFARLFHSSLIDLETLAKPTIVATNREESVLKYLGVWASRTVNINTAPRHVLEAAFTFGGDADKIADEIIKRRRIKPFASVGDMEKALLRYSTSIKKCESYITTTSDTFTIRVTATSGVASAEAIIALTKVDKNIQKIAVLSG